MVVEQCAVLPTDTAFVVVVFSIYLIAISTSLWR